MLQRAYLLVTCIVRRTDQVRLSCFTIVCSVSAAHEHSVGVCMYVDFTYRPVSCAWTLTLQGLGSNKTCKASNVSML
jgi:hypothetical protein